jgi:hypothetical protein
VKSEALILFRSQRRSAQPLGTQAFKNSSTKLNTLSVSIEDSQKKSIWFMQVFSLAKLPPGETFLERIVTKQIHATSNNVANFMSCSEKRRGKNVK